MMSGNQSDEMSSVKTAIQLIAANEVKQEPDIKEEPMTTDDLVEFPAIINDAIGQPSGNPSQYDGGGLNVNFPFYAVKNEVKPERTEKKKKKKASGTNGSNKATMANRKQKHSMEHATCNVKKPRKTYDQGKDALKQHRCDQCKYATDKKSHLKRHLLTHIGKKLFPCTHCPKQFTQQQYLRNHMKMHVKEFLFNCTVCLQGFDDEKDKLEHEKKCSIRRNECHLCKQSFGSKKGNLINHIRVHSGAKPFQCKECLKQFIQKSHLKRHMKQHSGPPSFP